MAGGIAEPVLRWLLDGDPAIRWQVFRDLAGSGPRAVTRERNKVAREGWGARLLALQDGRGRWGGGLYNPKWTSTTYTLLMLRDLGLPADNSQAHKACAILLDEGLRSDGGVNFGSERSETCITGMTLSILAHFQHDDGRVDRIAEHLLGQQMPDGGWNCRRSRGDTHSSVHTTISALEGLRLYELSRRQLTREAVAAQQQGREFLLTHRLFRSHRTGNVIKPEFKAFRLSSPLALRHPAGAGSFSGRRRTARFTPSRSGGHRPPAPASGWLLVTRIHLQRKVVLPTGTSREAEPVEHPQGSQSPEVVG